MTAASSRRRGEPLVALAILAVAWTGARWALWESPFANTAREKAPRIHHPPQPALSISIPLVGRRHILAMNGEASVEQYMPVGGAPGLKASLPRYAPIAEPMPMRFADLAAAATNSRPIAVPMPGPSARPSNATSAPRQWRFDAWVAWRQGSGIPRVVTGPRPVGYGGSQAGFLAQYDLASGPRRPALHVRGTYAPDRPRQADLAAGFGIRPIARVPVRVLGEARLTHAEGFTEVRPAVLAVSELAPVSLPLGFMGEGYVQAGWVGGRYPTAFADGQARIERPVADIGPVRLRAGVGAWAGAQKFADRVDVGPTVAIALPRARLSIDYRFRAAGNASPQDGLAVTLSTGF